MKLSYLLKENKIVLYTNPEYFGADVPDEYLERPRTPVPVSDLYGYEPDDKMDDIHHANDVLKLALHMKKGGTVPPIVVRKTVKGYQVLDGHHRMHAAKKAGVDQLDAVIVDRGDIEYSDEVKEGRFARTAGAAALAGACVAGTPGCVAVDTKDTLRTVQTVGRTAQTVRDMGRAGAEEELINILRDRLRNIKNEDERVPRKKDQPAGSKKHSDLYTDENPRGTIQGLKFATVADAEASVNKIKRSGRSHAHKIQAAVAMEQRARAADKISAADVYRKYINSMKKKTQAKANEQTTNIQYSPGKRLTDFPTVGNIYGKKDLDKAATPARLQKKPIKKNPSIYAESLDTFTLVREAKIPVYKQPSQFYAGGKQIYKMFRQAFPNLPEHVANDIYNQTSPGTNPDIVNNIKQGVDPKKVFLDYFSGKTLGFAKDPATNLSQADWRKVLLHGRWKQQILTVNPGDFAATSLNRMRSRNFGVNPGENPERIQRQQSAAKGDGSNEPVTIINTRQGLVLWEGFHRTMSILSLGRNGDDPQKWNKVKLRAWVVEFDNGQGVTEAASGYIPTAKEKNDPRFKTALTVDVRPGETQRQAAKLGMKIDKAGNPPLLHKSAAKNTTPNKAYNLGLAESLWAKYRALKEGKKVNEEELVEISQTPSAIRDWAASEAAQGVIAGFEAEVIMPNIGSMEEEDDGEPDFDENRRPSSIDDVIEFFKYAEFGLEISGREARILEESLRNDYQEWVDGVIQDEFNFDQFKQVCKDEGWYQDLVNEEIDGLNDDRDEIAQEIFNKDYDDLSDDDQSDVNRDIADRAEEQAFERLQSMYSGDSGFYSDALDVFRQQRYDDGDLDEESWFESDRTDMMDIADQQGLSWPYVSGTAGDPDAWENLGRDLQGTLGREVRVSSGYHSMGRGNYYIMEPDSSISPDSSDDAGVEIVSPPMPLKQAQSQLSELIGWLKANEAYTNESTGLHMGISLPDANIDYTKLVLFTGDKYMLDQFDRAYNTYAKSALDKLVDQVQYSKKSEGNFSKIDIAEAMKLIRKGLASLAGDIVRGRVGNDKYTSIHIKSGYIEFRIAGGNWIDKAEQAELAMLRFARAYTIAADQDAERREYLQKLYKLISAENPVENLWAQYQAGTISAEQLKDAWANQVLGIDPDAGKQDPFGDRTYQVRIKDTGDVIKDLYARDREEAEALFQNYLKNFHKSIHKDYVLVDPTKITKPVQGRKADVAKRLQQRTRIFRFELTKPDTEALRARGAALEGVRQALKEQETQTFLVPAQDEQSARAKLPYYADWITPRSASRATVAQVLPAKAETMPKEPEYANKDFAFQFNLLDGDTQTVKISAPNRASAVEELANKVKKRYGVLTRIENLKQVDPNSVKDVELQDEPEEQTYEVEVKIQSGDNIDYKLFDVKARNEYLALSKAEEAVRRNNPNSVLTAKIVNRT